MDFATDGRGWGPRCCATTVLPKEATWQTTPPRSPEFKAMVTSGARRARGGDQTEARRRGGPRARQGADHSGSGLR